MTRPPVPTFYSQQCTYTNGVPVVLFLSDVHSYILVYLYQRRTRCTLSFRCTHNSNKVAVLGIWVHFTGLYSNIFLHSVLLCIQLYPTFRCTCSLYCTHYIQYLFRYSHWWYYVLFSTHICINFQGFRFHFYLLIILLRHRLGAKNWYQKINIIIFFYVAAYFLLDRGLYCTPTCTPIQCHMSINHLRTLVALVIITGKLFVDKIIWW